MAKIKDGTRTKVITNKVRFSYANVFKPKALTDGADPKYSVCLLIPKDDRECIDVIQKAIQNAINDHTAMWGGKIPRNLKTPLRDGDEERGDQEEFVNHFFINASSNQKPGLVDKNRAPIADVEEFYSGCYGRASVNFYGFSVSGNKGIACGLNNLQKLEDGERLMGHSRPEDDFDDEFQEEKYDFLQ